MAIYKMNQHQTIVAHHVMEKHCKKGEDGFVIYEEGWDDERLVKEVQAANPEPERPISAAAIKNLRLNMFGRLKAAAAAADPRIEQLETRLKAVEDQLIHITTWLQKFKYSAPPGRPQSTPPEKLNSGVTR